MYKSSKEHLSDILKESIEEFTKYTTKYNLTAQHNLEKERANAYHGRELLELLQNVDDAYEELCIQNPEKRGLPVETIIEYDETKSILRISNIGTVFSESSINRLCQGGVSQKKINFIGNKGTGFRSLLNWAKEIHIYSGEYSVGFSEEYANSILNSIKDIPIVQKQLKDEPKIKFPMLQAPYFIEPIKSDFDTVIEIIVKPDSLFDNWNINNQIKEFDKTILLFLPNITKIKFKLINEEYSFNKKKDTSESRFDKYSIQKLDNTDNILEEKSYFVFKKEYNLLPTKDEEEEKKVKLCVAIPCKYEQLTNCKLYTFFPIKEATSPFNVLLNATFELSQNRDSINNSVINQNVFNSLLEFYVDIIINNFCIKEFGDLAIQLLTPVRYKKDFRFNSPFDDDSIINKYIELCKSKKIFFNYNKEFISAQEYPKIDVNYPALFHNLYFKELIPIPSQEIICFLKDLSGIDNCEYSTKELYDRINLSKRIWNIENNIEVFIWWIQHYPNNEILPELIKDKNGNWLHTNDKCFFSGTIKDVPNWASYKIINLEYENKLIDYCSKTCRKDLDAIKATTPNEDDKRLVIRFIRKNSLIQTSEYSVSNLLSPLNESIDNDYDRAKDFVKWLWENKEIIKNSESIKNDNYNFPNKEGSVSASGSLFMGEEYNNSFGEQIFSNLEFKKFINPETLGISKENINDAKHFFNEYFGVLIYPKIHKAKINYERVKYDSLLSKYISIKEKKKCNYIESSDMIVNTIDKIDYILSKLDTETILKFIFSYNDLYENIINTENNNFENLKYFLYRAHYWNTFYGKIPNYLTFVFSNYKWLEIGGKKYSPNECIFSEDSILCRHIPCITSDYIKNINISGHSEKEIKKLLEFIGVKNKEIELSSDNFYKLLLSLQEQDNTNKISQRIYRECIKNLENPFELSENKMKFFIDGKVCVRNPKENESVYQPVNKVFFSSKNVLNLSNKYLIYIPLRTGNKQSIEEWFNVKEYTEDYDVIDDSIVYSILNDEFRKNFKEYLPYAFCLRKEEANETEQRKFKNLSIKLVSEIKIKLDNTSKYITEKYALIQNKKNESQWFIYVGNILEYDDIDISKIGDLLEQIFSVIINTENKDKIEKFSELYVSNKDRRNHIIKKEFNSLDILRESKNFLDGIISDKDVLRDYLKKEHLLTDEISNLLNKLDFSFTDDIETQKILFKLLKKLNMDVNLLNSKLNRDDISIYLYNKERLNIAINNIMKKIKQNIYNTLLNKELIDKKQFLKQIDDAKDKICNSIEIQNTIFFEPDNECKKYYEENYNIDYEPIDIEERFKNNRKFFKESNQNDDINKFLNNQEIKSLLYFDVVDVQKEFNKFISNNTEQTETETQTEAENNENRIVTITDNVKPVIENTERHGTKKSFHKIISSEEQQKQTEKNQRQGDLAEQIVVNKLRNYEFPELNAEFNNEKYNIIWCSGAAERIENYNGNDSLGYDIELELNGKTMYIEVKSSSKEECSFEMSSNEYNFAIKQRDNYRLIFVANANTEPKITLLPKDFLKTFETIPKSYIIQFKIK